MRFLGIFLSTTLTIYFFSFYDVSAEETADLKDNMESTSNTAKETELTEKTVLASVNGEDITVGNFISFQSRLPNKYQSMEDSVLFDGILKQLIQQTILSQKVNINSNKIKYALENQTRAFLSTKLVGSLSEVEIEESEIEIVYVDFSTSIEQKREYNASHILAETETEAEDVLVRLKNGSDFAELAKTLSIGPSGAQGGNLGWFGQV
jgi:peptidyl-prolyl cis-trans isomerase C